MSSPTRSTPRCSTRAARTSPTPRSARRRPATITGTAASKGWNLPGLKCAQLLLSNDRDAATWTERGATYEHGASTPGVRASTAAYRDGGPWLDDAVAYLDGSRSFLGGLLAEQLPEVGYQPPEGTYLAWLDCRALGLGDSPGEFFLDKAQVLVNDGPAFGVAGKGCWLSFATPQPILNQGRPPAREHRRQPLTAEPAQPGDL